MNCTWAGLLPVIFNVNLPRGVFFSLCVSRYVNLWFSVSPIGACGQRWPLRFAGMSTGVYFDFVSIRVIVAWAPFNAGAPAYTLGRYRSVISVYYGVVFYRGVGFSVIYG